MQNKTVIGIDLGGTNVRAGTVNEQTSEIVSVRINGKGSVEEVLRQVFSVVGKLINPSVTAIGIGVPGLVDLQQGVVFDVVNIPSWKEVPLQQLVEDRYQLPVFLNNDANCFALGEFYFGKGKGVDSMVGLTVGTGLGTGIIIHKNLYAGANCGAGEFGMAAYLDKYYEYYCAGQFFKNVYKMDGEEVFKLAEMGDKNARNMYAEMGMHLGNAIKLIQYSLDPHFIVVGGSVRKAWKYFNIAMRQQIQTSVFQKSVQRLQIEVSELENSGILGAAALCYA